MVSGAVVLFADVTPLFGNFYQRHKDTQPSKGGASNSSVVEGGAQRQRPLKEEEDGGGDCDESGLLVFPGIQVTGQSLLVDVPRDKNRLIARSFSIQRGRRFEDLSVCFVTNFPDSFSAKDLFHSCKTYGHVVDSYIPLKKTKGGKRFGFVRFINVFNSERLINNLCTLWNGRLKLHANIARAKEVPGWVPEFADETEDESIPDEDLADRDENLFETNGIDKTSDSDAIPETIFTHPDESNKDHSPDPFDIYDLLNKDKPQDKQENSQATNKSPTGRIKLPNTNLDAGEVYAPHDKREKGMLWDYLSSLANNWSGEVIMMGDFNEVRLPTDRFGTAFHVRDAQDLYKIDSLIDTGQGTDEIVLNRMEIINSIHTINKLSTTEILQKSKIKWAVEGDENSHFFHGILNKRRKEKNVRGIMKDGTWIDNPILVKDEFLTHFQNRFARPADNHLSLTMDFPKTLSLDQKEELESKVTRGEIKRVVWDCGVDKSPGPNGFTFGFYRRFWDILENDV
nr:RNA-directed DNA polymerase, eukaryota [Tanacetum cinerariifolium]